ncbi:MAG: hypothetical protein DWQ01_10830 [Planctomycetota bacterium]|nr:MAG: hypothetical protein DWQ01_10830 [Planctomycetota bacterium]
MRAFTLPFSILFAVAWLLLALVSCPAPPEETPASAPAAWAGEESETGAEANSENPKSVSALQDDPGDSEPVADATPSEPAIPQEAQASNPNPHLEPPSEPETEPKPELELADTAENIAETVEPPAQGVDFVVDFGQSGATVAPALLTSVNDFPNADPGCWEAYRQVLQPEPGSLARIWIRYTMSRFADRHIKAGLAAAKAGLDVYVCAVGAPEHYAGPNDAGAQAFGKAPRSPEDWAATVARDVSRMRQRGVPVRYIEIWNEPDLPRQWHGSDREFAQFFARAGRHLKELLPEVNIGGPGMANNYGGGRRLFEDILDACQRLNFEPDFLSFHDYLGYPTDQHALGLPTSLAEEATQRGFAEPELILSEWNITLPRPVAPELDDHRAGAYFVSMTTALAYTKVKASIFFQLQDGAWEAKRDYAGESVGIFTLRGGPKPVLVAMQMCKDAASFPMVAVERRQAPWNLSLLATREGERGYLLISNAFGEAEHRVHKMAMNRGIDPQVYKGSEPRIRKFLAGRLDYEGLGLPASDRPVWEEARASVLEDRRERQRRSRPVRLHWRQAPDRITGVWLLDKDHGRAMSRPDFARLFESMGPGLHDRVVESTMEELRKGGTSETDLQKVERVLRKRDRQAARQLRADLAGRAEALYRQYHKRLSSETPVRLAKHAASAPWPLAADAWDAYLQRQERELVLNLAPFSAMLVELQWEAETETPADDD